MAAVPTRRRKTRLSRADWVRAALDAIAERGLAGVSVEPLAAQLGVTKGSFYAHFASRDELIEATLASWEQSHGAEGPFAGIEDPGERLRELLMAAIAFSQSGAPSVHVSLLGELGDERVRAAVARVTEARMQFIADAYRELGLPPQRASDRARLVYATYVGLLQMSREAPDRRLAKREFERFAAELSTVLIETS
jgi:AcrR family transcriptional regulator